MSLTYYDSVSGRNRIKRRFVWGFWGYAAGAVTIEVLRYLV